MATGSVAVNFTVTNQQLLNFLQQAAKNAAQVNQQINQVNKGLGGVASSAQKIAFGIGGYQALYGIMNLGNRVLKTSVQHAAAMEQTMLRMKLVANATDSDMTRLINRAEKVGALLPGLTTEDVLENQERLGRLLGKNTDLIDKYTESFSAATANIHLFTKGRFSPDAVGAILEEALASFGGFGGKLDIDRFLKVFQAGVLQVPGTDPTRLFQGLRSAIPAMQALGMTPDQIIQLGVFRAQRPTGGVRAAGRDISQLIMDSIGALEGAQKNKKSAGKKMGLLEEFGILRGGKPVIIDEQGNVDVRRLFASMEAQTEMMKKTLSPADFKMKVAQLGEIGFGQMAQRMLLQGFSGTTVDELTKVQSEMKRVADSLDKFVQDQRKTTTGAYETVTSTAESMITHAMMEPNTYIGKMLYNINQVLEKMQIVQQRGTSGVSNSILGLVGGLGIGGAGLGMGMLSGGAANLAGGIFGGWLSTILSGLSTALLTAGVGGLVTAAIAAVVLAGITAYHTSSGFHDAVDKIAELVTNMFSTAFNFLTGGFGNMKWVPGQGLQTQFAGTTAQDLRDHFWEPGGWGKLLWKNMHMNPFADPSKKPLLRNPPVHASDSTADIAESIQSDATGADLNTSTPTKAPNPYGFTGHRVTNPNAGPKKAMSRRNLMDALQEHLHNTMQNDFHWSSQTSGFGPSYLPRR